LQQLFLGATLALGLAADFAAGLAVGLAPPTEAVADLTRF
jgi:hypothetical protein